MKSAIQLNWLLDNYGNIIARAYLLDNCGIPCFRKEIEMENASIVDLSVAGDWKIEFKSTLSSSVSISGFKIVAVDGPVITTEKHHLCWDSDKIYLHPDDTLTVIYGRK